MSARLNRKLVLEDLEIIPDGAGGFTDTWTTLGVLWCALVHRGTRETQGQEIAQQTAKVWITVRAAPVGAPSRPQPGQRFREGGRRYRILNVAEGDGTGRYLRCEAREEVAT